MSGFLKDSKEQLQQMKRKNNKAIAVLIWTLIGVSHHSSEAPCTARLMSTVLYLHKLFPVGRGFCPESTRRCNSEGV